MGHRGDEHRIKVVVAGKETARGIDDLRAHTKTPATILPFPVSQETRQMLKELADADVVVASYFTQGMARAAHNLKLLQAPSAGVDAFRTDVLSPSVTVANAYFHGPAVAEYVLMMVLALSRDMLNIEARFRKGSWVGSWVQGKIPREEVVGKTLGLIGYGHIGREVASRARAMGMSIKALSAHPPKRKPGGVDFWTGPAGLTQLLKESDYVVLACPLNKDTRGLIGPREFAQMKRNAFLINVARGAVVQEEALYRALKGHRIAGAAIDVWYRYPKNEKACRPSRFPFHKLSNVIMTPHIAGWMLGTRQNRLQLVSENIDRLVAGKPLLNVIQGPRKHVRSWNLGRAGR